MNFQVYASLGYAPRANLGSIDITPPAMASESSHAGAYHVLHMGAHFQDYVIAPHFPSLGQTRGFPAHHPYMQSTSKMRAGGVTGNIGEAAASIVMRRVFKMHIFDIAHLRPTQAFARRKAPDYLMRIPRTAPGLAALLPASVANVPEWWPIESKARNTDAAVPQAHREGLRQLGAYWHTIHSTHPQDAGFGATVCMKYNVPGVIHVRFVVPRNQSQLIARLNATTYDDYVKEFPQDRLTMGSIYA